MGNIISTGALNSFRPSNQTLTHQPLSPAKLQQTGQPSSVASHTLETDSLESHIAQYKAQSITYQLLKAIAAQVANKDKVVQQKPELAYFAQSLKKSIQLTFETSAWRDQTSIHAAFDYSVEQRAELTISDLSLPVGIEFDFDFEFETETQFSFTITSAGGDAEAQHSDPLIINLNNTGFAFAQNQTIRFDLDADGQLDEISQLSADNYFLALDINQNGVIDNGRELFGDLNGSENGFIELARYDDDRNGQIDANDRIFQALLLSNLSTLETPSLTYLADTNITSLATNYTTTQQAFTGDNHMIAQSSYQRKDGSLGQIGDFLLRLK